jgi:hypothetical protein
VRPAGVAKRERERDLERRARREASSDGDARGDVRIDSDAEPAAPGERGQHTGDEASPPGRDFMGLDASVCGQLDRLVERIGGHAHDTVVAPPCANDALQIDGQRQNEAAVVIGVVAD